MTPTDDDPDLPVWDEDAALASVGGNRALALSLLKGLCATLPHELSLLRERHADGDLPGTAEQAHHISGGAAYCGVHALRSRLTLLEQRARAGDVNGCRIALSAVDAEATRLLAFSEDLS
ncbi:MAG: Hpt domain-containing protein [Thiohalocapsa sp.]|jgi:HPt (histidine-containing phosphotransfer) domain-containing protein|uniref:Hpt domain-containing protein n=1 Tax=Thiohalocapsa sp. TaxID=2497641 RepID=UPI0025FF7578|nr:Hpt domain-containing protein [Thiohalocapsa sp.]MCG6939658.1 Hpt domain-containing protein [Thiohalocapsa sp.]